MSWDSHHWLYYSSIFLEVCEGKHNLRLGGTVVEVRVRYMPDMSLDQPTRIFILKSFLYRLDAKHDCVYLQLFGIWSQTGILTIQIQESLQYEFSEDWGSFHKLIWDEIEIIPVKCRTDVLGPENSISRHMSLLFLKWPEVLERDFFLN